MYYGKTKSLSLLALPLLLALAFFVTTTVLAEASSAGPNEDSINPVVRLVDSGTRNQSAALRATSAVTGSFEITAVAVTDIGMTSAVVSWTTDVASDSEVRYGTATDALNLSATSPVTGAGTAHVVSLANLTPNTEYFFEVEVIERRRGEFVFPGLVVLGLGLPGTVALSEFLLHPEPS